MIFKCANAYYFAHLNSIGGVESHFYYLAKKYGNLDICLFYQSGDEYQINRLKKYVRCRRITPQDRVICDKIFVCYNREILDWCDAKEKILVLHADFKDVVATGQLGIGQIPVDPRIDKYVGVSQLVCDSWKELTGIEAENIYEPIVMDPFERPLMFLSATRLTREKGWHRMEQLADILNANHVNYTWMIYSDTKPTKSNGIKAKENMIFCPTRLDIITKMSAFDAYIQLSDNEGFCLSVVEALLQGVPVICTDLPVFRELGLNDTNSIRLNKSMDRIPVDRIKDIYKLHFDYKAPEDKWGDILVPSKSNYSLTKSYRVRANELWKENNITDIFLGHIPQPGEEYTVVGDDRLDMLLGDNPSRKPYVELID